MSSNGYGQDTEFGGEGNGAIIQRFPNADGSRTPGRRTAANARDLVGPDSTTKSVREAARVMRQVGKADKDLNAPDGAPSLTRLQQKYLSESEKAVELGSVGKALRARLLRDTNGYAVDADKFGKRVD